MHKYILHILDNVTCMYVFKADRLVLDNQLLCSSLRRAFPAFSISLLPIVLCLGLRTHEIFYILISISLGVLVQVTLKQSLLTLHGCRF